MKVECDVEKIKYAISQVERVTGKNLTLPVLNSILIIASSTGLKLRAMNLSLGVEVEVPAKIEKEGILAITGSILSQTFSNIFQKENITLEGLDGNLLIKTKRNKIKLKGQPYDDFPTIPIVEGDGFEVEAKKFIDGIKSVYYSAAPTDIKPEISSVCIYTLENDLVFVSTDSFRLAEKKTKIKIDNEINKILIPYKNISEIIRIFGEISGNLKVLFNKNQISITYNNIYLTSRVIDGNFPDYRQIIPKTNTTEVVVLKQDLLNALKLSNIFADKFNQVNLNVKSKEKLFEVSSQSTDIGENKTALDVSIKGDDVELSFNYKYFLDCFNSINTDSLSIKMNEPTKPIVITPVGDNSFTYLIMPMNR